MSDTFGDLRAIQRTAPFPEPGMAAKQDPPLQSTLGACHDLADRLDGQIGDLRAKLAPILTQEVSPAGSSDGPAPFNVGSSQVAQALYQLHSKLDSLSKRLYTITSEIEV